MSACHVGLQSEQHRGRLETASGAAAPTRSALMKRRGGNCVMVDGRTNGREFRAEYRCLGEGNIPQLVNVAM